MWRQQSDADTPEKSDALVRVDKDDAIELEREQDVEEEDLVPAVGERVRNAAPNMLHEA